LKILDDYTRF